MKKKIILYLLFILCILATTSCDKKEYFDNNKESNAEEKINYEEKVLNSTVNIYTNTNNFGAGFVVDKGYIITNYHVISDAEDIIVNTYKKEKYIASLIGEDYESDIAVLKIDKELIPLELGNSDNIKIGDEVIAIGNPNGDLSFSKAKGKILSLDQELLNKIDRYRKYIWYDGNAITGYSGGPVYDNNGRIIGILNSRYIEDISMYDFDNLCGIIPINSVKQIINNIINNE